MPRLDNLVSGVKHVQTRSVTPTKPRLPITPVELEYLRAEWLRPPVKLNNIMLWAAACTGFFGFLGEGEFTVPTVQGYDPEVHLNLGDIAQDSHTAPSLIQVHIKQSKIDPFRKGVDI